MWNRNVRTRNRCNLITFIIKIYYVQKKLTIFVGLVVIAILFMLFMQIWLIKMTSSELDFKVMKKVSSCVV